jgi:hypothetical protein
LKDASSHFRKNCALSRGSNFPVVFVDNRRQLGPYLVSASCMTIPYPDSFPNSERWLIME